MKLVDPRKLPLYRDVVDIAVAEMVFSSDQSRRECLLRLGDELGYRIEFFKVDEWYMASAQLTSVWDEIDLYHEHADFDRCADLDIETRRRNTAIASSGELAAIALVLRLLDENTDIFFDEQDAADFYPANFIADFERRIMSVEDYIRQERWFGDVPQWGRAEDMYGIIVSDDWKTWCDGYGNRIESLPG